MHTATPNNELLDENEAGEYLNVPARTLGQWRYLNKGPAFIRVGPRHVRYRRSDLDAYLDAHRVVPQDAA